MNDSMDELRKILDRIREQPSTSVKDEVSRLTPRILRDYHASIQRTLALEDGLPADARKKYGVREHADWRKWADAIENKFVEQKIDYTPIEWGK